MECGILEIFKAACELNNNVTIMVELAIGVGLALFLYRMQHKSTKKQRKIWESHNSKLYNDYRDIFFRLSDYYRHVNPGNKIINDGRRRDHFIHYPDSLSQIYKKLETSIHEDREFIDVTVLVHIEWFVDNCKEGPFDIFKNDETYLGWRIDIILGLIDDAQRLK